jgi:hypothetical protein
MSSNAFPIIQTPDPTLNRIQTNIQTTFAATQAATSGYFIGQIMFLPVLMTGQQAMSALGPGWVVADGFTSIVKSSYTALTNANVAPAVPAPDGTLAYIKVN